MKKHFFAFILMCSFATSSASAGDRYFGGVDKANQESDMKSDGNTELGALVIRYYRIRAKLSMYAMYCDHKNKKKWNNHVRSFVERMKTMEAKVMKFYGKESISDTKFDTFRNEESSRFVELRESFKGDRAAQLKSVCEPSQNEFLRIVGFSSKDVDNYLSQDEI